MINTPVLFSERVLLASLPARPLKNDAQTQDSCGRTLPMNLRACDLRGSCLDTCHLWSPALVKHLPLHCSCWHILTLPSVRLCGGDSSTHGPQCSRGPPQFPCALRRQGKARSRGLASPSWSHSRQGKAKPRIQTRVWLPCCRPPPWLGPSVTLVFESSVFPCQQ